MSAPQLSKPNGKGALPQGGASEGETKKPDPNLSLVEKMGSRKGYDPIPPDQHDWQMGKGQPETIRIWSWLCKHTIALGHRKEYAVRRERDGSKTELHLEHAAADLEMDIANLRKAWAEGVKRGLWHHGKEAGEERRLFLSGEVRPDATTQAEAQKVCTDLWSDYILKQIKDWPEERRQSVRLRLEREEVLERETQAALIAANRNIFSQRKDTIWHGEGVKPYRIDQHKKGETPDQAGARRARLQPVLPIIERFVQTFEQSVQSEPPGTYGAEKPGCTDPATLLPASVASVAEKREAGRDSDVVSRPSAKNSHEEVQHAEYLHAGELPALQTDEECEAEALLFGEIGRYQKAYKRENFGSEPISQNNKSHQLLIRRMLWCVRPGNALDFCFQVVAKFKGLDRNALGKGQPRSPAHPNGPRSLSLLLTWAMDYHSKLDPDPHCDRNLAELILAAGTESTWVSEKDREWARALLNRKGRTNGGAQ